MQSRMRRLEKGWGGVGAVPCLVGDVAHRMYGWKCNETWN